MKKYRLPLSMLVALACAALAIAGCGSDDEKSDSSASSADTPAPLEAGGEFAFCTDVPYPPAEYQEGPDFVGYEIDIAKEVSKRLGVTAEFQKTGFDGIIAALQAKKCDAIISSMNNTEERREQVNFVDYMSVGQSLLVPADEAADVTALEDLAGKTVAVQVGTTLKEAIDAVNETLDDPITVQAFPDAGAAAAAVQTGKVDAFFTDSPVAADYVNKQPDTYALGGDPIDPLPVSIAIRLDDAELLEAVQDAIDGMYEDGTMMDILEEWKVESFALTDAGDES